jgi:hypothetical protein
MAQLTLHIQLSEDDPLASAIVAEQKFNKLGFVSQEWDDSNYEGALKGSQLWKDYTCTDGCGNPINFKGAVALNRGTGNPEDEGYNPGVAQVPQLNVLRDLDFDIENHSFFHTDENPLNQSVLLDGIIHLRMAYRMRVLVIPTNFIGYTHSAKLMGYIASSGQGAETFDEYSPGIGTIIPLHEPLDPVFFGLTRYFVDEWNVPGAVQIIKNEFDKILTGERNFLVVGTHSGIDTSELLAGFTSFYDHIRTNSNDRILVCSTREALEYIEMRTMPISQTVSGNILTVTVDIANLNPRNRWRDLSFNVSSTADITGVTVEGFSSATFNPVTKLVNGFLQKKIWRGTTPVEPEEPDNPQPTSGIVAGVYYQLRNN